GRWAARKVSRGRIHGAPWLNRCPATRRSQRMIHAPHEQRVEYGLERPPLGREAIPDLALAGDLARDDRVRLEGTKAGAEPLRRDRRERSPQVAEATRTGEQVADDQQRPPFADRLQGARRRAEVLVASLRPGRGVWGH